MRKTTGKFQWSFDYIRAANFSSCTVRGNLNVGSLNWKDVSTATIDVLTKGGGHQTRTFFVQG